MSGGESADHPDVHSVQPESKSRRIVIDQIRELEQSVQRKPLMASGKAVIIYDADRLQPQAARTLSLKRWKSRPPGSLILLLSALPEAMLETVLSRCVEVPLAQARHGKTPVPEEQAILRALTECLIKPPQPGASDAFRFTRAIQTLLADARERIGDENDETLKAEASPVQAGGGWLFLVEGAHRANEVPDRGRLLRERERILQIVLDILSRALRAQHGHPDEEAVVRDLAGRFDARTCSNGSTPWKPPVAASPWACRERFRWKADFWKWS